MRVSGATRAELEATIARLEGEMIGKRLSEPFRSELIAKLLELGWPDCSQLDLLRWAATWSPPSSNALRR